VSKVAFWAWASSVLLWRALGASWSWCFRRGQVGVGWRELAHPSVSVEVDEMSRGRASWQIGKDMTIFLDEERRNGAPLPVMALDRSGLQRLTG